MRSKYPTVVFTDWWDHWLCVWLHAYPYPGDSSVILLSWALLNIAAHVFVYSPPGYWLGAWWTTVTS